MFERMPQDNQVRLSRQSRAKVAVLNHFADRRNIGVTLGGLPVAPNGVNTDSVARTSTELAKEIQVIASYVNGAREGTPGCKRF